MKNNNVMQWLDSKFTQSLMYSAVSAATNSGFKTSDNKQSSFPNADSERQMACDVAPEQTKDDAEVAPDVPEIMKPSLVDVYIESMGDDGPVPADVCERMRNAICKINTAVEGEAVTAKSLREAAGLGSRQYFASTVIKPLLEGGYIERSIPDKPQHPKQGYFLTQKGWLVREAYRLTSEVADM